MDRLRRALRAATQTLEILAFYRHKLEPIYPIAAAVAEDFRAGAKQGLAWVERELNNEHTGAGE